jgi:hypothetical protein
MTIWHPLFLPFPTFIIIHVYMYSYVYINTTHISNSKTVLSTCKELQSDAGGREGGVPTREVSTRHRKEGGHSGDDGDRKEAAAAAAAASMLSRDTDGTDGTQPSPRKPPLDSSREEEEDGSTVDVSKIGVRGMSRVTDP